MFKRYCAIIGLVFSVVSVLLICDVRVAVGQITGGPDVSLVTPAPDSTIGSINPQFSLRFSEPDQLDPNTIFQIDNINVTPKVIWDGIYQTYEDSCTGESYQVKVNDDYTNGVVTAQMPTLSTGQHTIYFKLSDKLGNSTEQTYNFFIADTKGPQIVDCYPLDGAVIDVIRPEIKVSLIDDNQIVANSVYLSIDGSEVDCVYNFLTSTVNYKVPQVLANGTYKVELRATDIFGNLTTRIWNFTVYVDRTPAQLSSIVPVSGTTVPSLTPAISMRFFDPGGIDSTSVLIRLDGNNLKPVVAYDGIYQTYIDSCTGEPYQVQVGIDYTKGTVSAQSPKLIQGQHTIYYYLRDKTEIVLEGTYSFTVSDTEGPQVAESYPAQDVTINNDKPLIKIKLSDSNSIVANSVYLSLNGEKLNAAYDINTCTMTYQITERLTNGTYSMAFSAQDELGNSSSKAWNFIINADQTGPDLKDFNPSANSRVVSINPLISFNFSDLSVVDKSTFLMKIDGVTVNAAIEYEGIYQENYDSCTGETYTTKIGEDSTKGRVYYQAKNLENNKDHTVEVYLGDKFGNLTNYAWAFKVLDDSGPRITPLLPEPTSLIDEAGTAISAEICDDNGVDPDKVAMLFNGESVGLFDVVRGIITYKPSFPLLDGHYTVAVAAYDTFGNYGSTNWTFDVRHLGLPEINNLLPPPQSGTRTNKPTISAKVKDNGGIDVNRVNISLDGSTLPTRFTGDLPGSIVSGTVYAVPQQELGNGMHTAVVTVFDRAGNQQQQTWNFGVNQFGDMAGVSKDCSLCHTEGIDAIERRHIAGAGDCNLCHGRGIDWDPGCCYCHGHDDSYPPPVRNVACVQCHNSQFWDAVPTHGSPAELNTHNYSLLKDDCLKCHSSYLTREHNLYVEGSGIKFDCNTCHKSSNPEVIQAITTKNLACSSCHSSADHETVHETAVDPACKQCHEGTLTADHMTNRPSLRIQCETCHDPGNSKYSSAIESGNKDCSTCHSQFHSLMWNETVPPDLPLYSGFVWSQPLDASVFSNDPSSPPGFESGRLVLSSRRTDIEVGDVWSFYKNQLTTSGWTLVSGEPAAESPFFDTLFSKNNRSIVLKCYNTENSDGTGTWDYKACRIEIWYK